MKKTLILLVLITSMIQCGCSNQEPLPPHNAVLKIENEYFVSLEDALKAACRKIDRAFGETRGNSREVLSVEMFHPNATRGHEDPTALGFYVVNFENNSGFAILSADNRRDTIYAFSNEGKLHLGDTTENLGLNWYINKYLSSVYNDFPKWDSLQTFEPFIPTTQTEENVCKPLLKGFMPKFHQTSPYNKYCRTKNGLQAVCPLGHWNSDGILSMANKLEWIYI